MSSFKYISIKLEKKKKKDHYLILEGVSKESLFGGSDA